VPRVPVHLEHPPVGGAERLPHPRVRHRQRPDLDGVGVGAVSGAASGGGGGGGTSPISTVSATFAATAAQSISTGADVVVAFGVEQVADRRSPAPRPAPATSSRWPKPGCGRCRRRCGSRRTPPGWPHVRAPHRIRCGAREGIRAGERRPVHGEPVGHPQAPRRHRLLVARHDATASDPLEPAPGLRAHRLGGGLTHGLHLRHRSGHLRDAADCPGCRARVEFTPVDQMHNGLTVVSKTGRRRPRRRGRLVDPAGRDHRPGHHPAGGDLPGRRKDRRAAGPHLLRAVPHDQGSTLQLPPTTTTPPRPLTAR
jgi:hypothetical protein